MMITVNGLTIDGPDALIIALRTFYRYDDSGNEIPPDLETIRSWAVGVVNSQPQPYTAQEYIEARRWQEQQNTSLILDTGRLSPTEYAKIVVRDYEYWQRLLKLRLSLLAQAKSIEEIEAILGRL